MITFYTVFCRVSWLVECVCYDVCKGLKMMLLVKNINELHKKASEKLHSESDELDYYLDIKKMDKIEMYKLLVSDEIRFNLSQKFRISYSIEDIKIQPIFTWAFDENINKYIQDWSKISS